MFNKFFNSLFSSAAPEAAPKQLIDYYREWFFENEEFLAKLTPGIMRAYKKSDDDELNPKKIDDTFNLMRVCVGSVVLLWLQETSYGKVLLKKRNQLIYKDDYGDYVFDDWFAELSRFKDGKWHLFKLFYAEYHPAKLTELIEQSDEYELGILTVDSSIRDGFYDIIHESIMVFSEDEDIGKNEYPDTFDSDDPYEYERFIAEKLQNLGWEARATSGSGDQGADIIAEKDGHSLVIQCKLYSQPVGNKAVQEAYAAKGFYESDECAVVSNHSFTKSARKLADSLDVKLVHDSRLAEFFGESDIEDDIDDSDETVPYSQSTKKLVEITDIVIETFEDYELRFEEPEDGTTSHIIGFDKDDIAIRALISVDNDMLETVLEMFIEHYDGHDVDKILAHNCSLTKKAKRLIKEHDVEVFKFD